MQTLSKNGNMIWAGTRACTIKLNGFPFPSTKECFFYSCLEPTAERPGTGKVQPMIVPLIFCAFLFGRKAFFILPNSNVRNDRQMERTQKNKKIGIIGAGNLGRVLGLALSGGGFSLASAATKTESSAAEAAEVLPCPVHISPENVAREAEIIFITTPDRAIEEVCRNVAQREGFREGQVVLHTSGAHSSRILSPASESGARVLSFHPLQTFPDLDAGLRSLEGTFFTVEGDEDAIPLAGEMIEVLKGRMLSIPTEMKPLYHAAACTACNYLTSLMDMALKMFEAMGVSSPEAYQALSPLINNTLHNIGRLGPEKALTGPIARGDDSTLQVHLEKMESSVPQLLPYYRSLGIYTAELAFRKGTLDDEGRKKIISILGG